MNLCQYSSKVQPAPRVEIFALILNVQLPRLQSRDDFTWPRVWTVEETGLNYGVRVFETKKLI